jgi:hypothetical protein
MSDHRDDRRRDDRDLDRDQEIADRQGFLIETKRRVLQSLLYEVTQQGGRWHVQANSYAKIDWYIKGPSGYSKGAPGT